MSRKLSAYQVRKYEAALYDLKSMDGKRLNSGEFCRKHRISDEFVMACKKMGVIENAYARANWIPGVDVDLFLAQDIVKIARTIRENRKMQRVKPTPKAQAKAPEPTPKAKPQPKATAPKPKAQPQEAPKRAEREQKSISILWGMISIKY